MTESLCIFLFFSVKKIIAQLFNDNGNIKPWEDIKTAFYLKDNHKRYWLEFIDALPKMWKDMKNVSKRMKNKGHVKRLVIFDYDFVGKSQICGLEKLTSRESYAILVKANTVKSTARNNFENLFEKSDFI